MGGKKTEDFISKMSGQIAGLIGCEAEDRIASGETPALVLDCMGGSQNRLRYRGKGILDTHIVSDMAQRRYSYLAIPAHTEHPNAAILYTLYISSPEGQEKVVWDLYGQDLDIYPESHSESKCGTEPKASSSPMSTSTGGKPTRASPKSMANSSRSSAAGEFTGREHGRTRYRPARLPDRSVKQCSWVSRLSTRPG